MFLNEKKSTGVSTANDTALVLDCHDGSTHLFFRVEEVFGLLFLSGQSFVHGLYKF